MLVPLKVPPGVFRQGTEYQSQGRYFDADLVRWFEGTLRPVGGWRQYRTAINGTVNVTGKARGMFAWRNNGNDLYAAIGTHIKLFAFGSAIASQKDITPAGIVIGFSDNQVNNGFGGNVYGVGTYGTQRAGQNITQFATTWSFDNFGEFLVAVQSQDGRLFYWDLLTATAVLVTATAGTVPISNKGVVVTDERFVFLLQAGGNRRRIAWSDQENLFNWQITATTQAGDFELSTNGEIMTAVKVRGQVLIITSTDAHVANYIGPPLVYGFERVGDGCGAISRNAAVVADKLAFWMSPSGFFAFDGFVKNLPSEVGDYVFSRINYGQAAKVWAVHSADFGEVTWYYPTGLEVDSYVTYNYRENHWSIGSMVRTIGIDEGVFNLPLRVDDLGFVYEHEVGTAYEDRAPFARTGPLEIDTGERVAMVRYMYPDERTQGQVQARFATRFYPNAQEYPHGPYDMSNPTSVRFTGRQVAMRLEGEIAEDFLVDEDGQTLVDGADMLLSEPVAGSNFRVGTSRLDIELGGLR